ncbi:MAG: WD40 repeat domain-containing protein, partial [Aquificaceae bacterium]|nr:WD40 repeat domain-containing protein [Aquificaceae bacterium]
YLNDKPIPLEKYERSRCYAIAPDGSGFVLGTEWYVRYYDSKGNLLWAVPVRIAWSVGISSNGRVVVAGLEDGTIRWYRASDGKELLALFPHKDGKRWVLWMPEGYYVASEGGEELIGWHLNRSADEEADFVPLSKFKALFNKPEVIRRLFFTYDVRKALELTGVQALEVGDVAPPTVSILSPEDGSNLSSTNLMLRVKVRNSSREPATALKVFVDGKEVYEHRLSGTLKPEEVLTLSVKVPERDTFELSVVAQNRYVEGVPQSIRLFYRKPTSPQERGR